MGTPTLVYNKRQPPLAVLLAVNLASSEIALQPSTQEAGGKSGKGDVMLKLASGHTLAGPLHILRYLSKLATPPLSGETPLEATEVEHWLDFASAHLVMGPTFQAAAQQLDSHLLYGTFLVGYKMSIADVVAWGNLAASPMWPKLKRSGNYPNLSRWYDFVAAQPYAAKVVATHVPKDGNASAAPREGAAGKGGAKGAPQTGGKDGKDAGKKADRGDAGGSFDINLPNAREGEVVVRFPPEPSGYMHIGHVKAVLLNQYFAQMYKGQLIVRFDDTNPSKEKDEFVDNILLDLEALGVTYNRLTYTSNYFPQLVDLATALIKAGHMYADDTPQEQMQQERRERQESSRRGRSVDENLAMWREMQAGSEQGAANCLRIKMDPQNVNGALRDPVCFRCNPTPHWRTGSTFKAYPTYDFACPFVDSFEGVTHALRTSEYKDREAQFYWMLKLQAEVWPGGLRHVHVWDYSRLNFVHTVLSKRKLTWFVDTGRVWGWNDPRFPTVQGILRRGMQVEALKEFILLQGASRSLTFQEWDKLWNINKKVIDPVCPRHTAVVTDGRCLLTMTNHPKTELVSVLRHKKHPPAGVKITARTPRIWVEAADAAVVNQGEEVTFMDWGNAFITAKELDDNGRVLSLTATTNPGGSVKTTKWKLTWLPDVDELVPLRLLDFDYLITKKKIEEDDDFQAVVNPNTVLETSALGDPNMRVLQKGDVIQLERKGYFIVDQPCTKEGVPMVLFSIPDGRAKDKKT